MSTDFDWDHPLYTSAFGDMVRDDMIAVFLNTQEFGERRTVKYDGEIYENIPVVLNGYHQQNRFLAKMNPAGQPSANHAEGLYLAYCIMHCALSDLGGNQPEKGARIQIGDEPDNPYFRHFRQYYVASSNVEMGMLRIELEAFDE